MRILRSTVMVRVGGGWCALDEFLVKNDPCRGEYTIPRPSTTPGPATTNIERPIISVLIIIMTLHIKIVKNVTLHTTISLQNK